MRCDITRLAAERNYEGSEGEIREGTKIAKAKTESQNGGVRTGEKGSWLISDRAASVETHVDQMWTVEYGQCEHKG